MTHIGIPVNVVRRDELKTVNSESLLGSGNISIPAGETGPAGADGASAYEIAVAGGFVGDEAAWLASLVGANGATGATGPAGPSFIQVALSGNGANVAAGTKKGFAHRFHSHAPRQVVQG
jgi:hypothetical protein